MVQYYNLPADAPVVVGSKMRSLLCRLRFWTELQKVGGAICFLFFVVYRASSKPTRFLARSIAHTFSAEGWYFRALPTPTAFKHPQH